MDNRGFGAQPFDVLGFDDLIICYIEECRQEGESQLYVSDLLSGLQHHIPALRGQLNGSWRIHACWTKLELPHRWHPLTVPLIQGVAGLCIAWKCPDVVFFLIGFTAFSVSTSEMCNFQVSHLLNASVNEV